MDRHEFQDRTEALAVRIAQVADALPKTLVGRTWGGQLLRSGSSIGANYCEAVHASSRRHFASTLEIAQREANETMYWLRIIGRFGLIKEARLQPLIDECNQIAAMLTASINTTKRKK